MCVAAAVSTAWAQVNGDSKNSWHSNKCWHLHAWFVGWTKAGADSIYATSAAVRIAKLSPFRSLCIVGFSVNIIALLGIFQLKGGVITYCMVSHNVAVALVHSKHQLVAGHFAIKWCCHLHSKPTCCSWCVGSNVTCIYVYIYVWYICHSYNTHTHIYMIYAVVSRAVIQNIQ